MTPGSWSSCSCLGQPPAEDQLPDPGVEEKCHGHCMDLVDLHLDVDGALQPSLHVDGHLEVVVHERDEVDDRHWEADGS